LIFDFFIYKKFDTVSILEKAGYKVLIAKNGEDAFEKIHSFKGKINLILTDIIMPGIDGREFVEKISKTHKDIKIV